MISLEMIVLSELVPQLYLRVNAKLLMHSDFEHVYLFTLNLEVDTDKEPFLKVNAVLFKNELIELFQHELKRVSVP